jgi:hypothetical protein
LYTAPLASNTSTDFYEWYERRYGKVNRADAWENAKMADAHEVWNAALASKE